MILQVLFDDQFGNYAIEQFRDYRDRTRIILITSGSLPQRIHDIPQQDIVVYESPEYKELITHLSDYRAVLMHGLFSHIQYDIIRHLPKDTKLAWVLWGAEIYSSDNRSMFRLAPVTRIVSTIKQYKNSLCNVHDAASKVPMDILKRVNYMLGSSLEIYEEAKTYIGNPKMKHLMYSYFTVERMIGEELLNQNVNGDNILLGNSAAVENNHLDIMLRLKRVGLPKNARLITPLSYSTPWVKVLINKVGRILFRKQFYPLLNFIPREQYNQLVQSCSVFIANHHNPNAFGNVLTSLWLGARVYVSKYNVQTKFLQRLGLHVNIIESDLTRRNLNLYKPLTDKERDENRLIIRNIYGADQMRKNIQYIIDVIDE